MAIGPDELREQDVQNWKVDELESLAKKLGAAWAKAGRRPAAKYEVVQQLRTAIERDWGDYDRLGEALFALVWRKYYGARATDGLDTRELWRAVVRILLDEDKKDARVSTLSKALERLDSEEVPADQTVRRLGEAGFEALAWKSAGKRVAKQMKGRRVRGASRDASKRGQRSAAKQGAGRKKPKAAR